MKALCFYEHGDLDVLHCDDVSDPEPGPGQVLVRVRACALNHLDVWVRRGWPGPKLEMPHWTGADVAGEVAALGGQAKACRRSGDVPRRRPGGFRGSRAGGAVWQDRAHALSW